MLNLEDSSGHFTVTGGGDADPQAYLNADQRGGTAPNGKPSKTIDQAGLHLVGGEPGWSAALGVAYTVTYAFRSTAPSTMPEDTGGFSRFNAAQIAQAELALLAWSDVANITFTRVGSGTSGEAAFSNSASILLGNYSSGAAGAAAFANYPGSPSASSSAGDVWVNSTLSYNRNPVQGNYGGLVLVHELGHTIGLSHPGDYDASDGLPITYANDAEYYEDSAQYTVMSYFDETDTGADYHGAYAASPMLDDISAAQQEYGVNLTTRTGDTVYGFNSTADRPWYLATAANTKLIFAAWDAGGNDTFDFSGFGVAQTIDLREGFFSDVGGLVGNVAVAKGAAIENAIGGSGVDTVTGNGLDNHLEGRNGSDFLYGQGGNDILEGGAGADILDGGPGFDNAFYTQALAGVTVSLALTGGQDTGEGVDTLVGIEALTGSAYDDLLSGDGGANVLTGGEGQDRLLGGAGSDVLFGGGGQDKLWGDVGDDWLEGGAGGDMLDGGSGTNMLIGGDGVDVATYVLSLAGVIVDLALTGPQDTGYGRDTLVGVETLDGSNFDDVLSGDGGANLLQGEMGQDWLVSRGGADVLVGGDGHDTLWGGDGDDVIEGGMGDDVIDGGAGIDGVSYGAAPAGVEIDLRIIEDQLTRGAGVDTLISIENIIGSVFADVLTLGAGPNAVVGNLGDDRFVFLPGTGADQVYDFGAGGDHDQLDLSGYAGTGVTWSVVQVAADTVVSFTNGDSVTLLGFDHNHLQASGDFLLAV